MRDNRVAPGSPRGGRRRRPGVPRFAKRYILTFAAFAGVYLAVVYVRAGVFGLGAQYFTGYLAVCLVAGVAAYAIDKAAARARAARGRDTADDWCEPPGLQVATFGGVIVLGSLLAVAILVAMLMAVGVWPPNRSARAADEPAGPPQVPPPATEFGGLIAYWPFDDERGTQAADAAGHGRVAELRGDVRRGPGVRGQALRFDPPNAGLDYGRDPAFDFAPAAPFTVAGWFATAAADGAIVSQRNARDGGPVIDVTVESGRLSGLVRSDGGEIGLHAQVVGPPVNDGAWHHFALVRYRGPEVELFVDGTSCGRASGSQSGGSITTDLRFAGREEYWVRVGYFRYPAYDGWLDELCVFDRALGPPEVARLAGR